MLKWLERYQARLRAQGAEAERCRVAQEIHDGITGYVFAVCGWIDLTTPEVIRHHPATAIQQLEQAGVEASRAFEELKRLQDGLMLRILDGPGLATALREILESTHRRERINCLGEILDDPGNMSQATCLHLCRIAQEAVRNAAKHGKPENITLSLRTNGPSGSLEIRDDGKGLPEQRDSKGVGLKSMQIRAKAMGGKLEVESAPGRGTSVTCAFPL